MFPVISFPRLSFEKKGCFEPASPEGTSFRESPHQYILSMTWRNARLCDVGLSLIDFLDLFKT